MTVGKHFKYISDGSLKYLPIIDNNMILYVGLGWYIGLPIWYFKWSNQSSTSLSLNQFQNS